MEIGDIKRIVRNNSARFSFLRKGTAFYRVDVPVGIDFTYTGDYGVEFETYEFPVPLDDIGDATLLAEDKAIFFMRYIRKAIEQGMFIKV